MGRLGLLGFVLSGCAQLAGIEETTGDQPVVSLSIERMSIGATVVRAPQDLTGHEATFLVRDAEAPGGFVSVAGALATPDTWSAVIPDATLAVQFDLPEPTPVQRLWQLPYTEVLGLHAMLEHPNPTPAPMTATVSLQLSVDPAWVLGESLQIYTLGSWTTRSVPEFVPIGGEVQIGPLTYPFISSSSVTGRPHELLTMDDAYLVLRYTGSQLIGRYIAAPFNQTEQTQLIGAMTAIPLDQTLAATLDPAAAQTRLGAVRPAVGNLAMNWSLRAAPGYEIGSTEGPGLHGGGIPLTVPPVTMLTATYGNPFESRDWRTVFTLAMQGSRTYTPPSAGLPVTLFAGMHEKVTPSAGTAMTLPAGLPELITLDGRPLSSDGLTIPLPTTAVEVSFITDALTNTAYQLQLFELVPNAAMPPTALDYKLVLSTFGTGPEFSLPPAVFAVGRLYTIRAISIAGGFPAIDAGDLRTRSLPIAQAFHDSGVFEVTP